MTPPPFVRAMWRVRLWVHMLQFFGIQWVMLGSVASLLFCWRHWLEFLEFGSRLFDVDRLDRTKSNHCSFEDIEKSLVQLKNLFQRTLFYWSQCWGSSDYSSIIEFLFSLRMSFNFSVSLFFCCFFFVHHCEHLVFFFLYLLSIILLILPIIKKRVQGPPIYV